MTLNIGESFLIRVIASIVVSIFIDIILLLVKPKIEFSDKICYCPSGGIYKIKIVNNACFMRTNIKYTLLYCKMHDDEILTTNVIKPQKSSVIRVDKYSIWGKHTNYNIRISYNIDFKKYPMNENTKIQFVFIATHPISNTTKCIKKEYFFKDIIEGVFEIDKST